MYNVHTCTLYLVIVNIFETTDDVEAFGYACAVIYLLYDIIKTVDLEGGEGEAREERNCET